MKTSDYAFAKNLGSVIDKNDDWEYVMYGHLIDAQRDLNKLKENQAEILKLMNQKQFSNVQEREENYEKQLKELRLQQLSEQQNQIRTESQRRLRGGNQ